jgi:protein-disulfide isomerase
MAGRHLAPRSLAWTVISALVLGSGSVWLAKYHTLHLVSTSSAAEMSQAEIEQIVKNYLLEHPEVVGEALNRLEAKQGELDAADAKAALKAHTNELFQDPDSPVGGNPNGDVTLVEFFDYNCPYCRAMAPLMTKAVESDPKLRIVYKEFPILGADSLVAAKAALAANKQGKYVAFHRALYQVGGHVDEAKVLEAAGTVGLDVARMKADMQDNAIESVLEKNNQLGQVLHITGTPGFVVGDEITTGARDFDAMQAIIAKGRSANQTTK